RNLLQLELVSHLISDSRKSSAVEEETFMAIEIIPTGAVLGAEIRGVGLARPLDEATFLAIERAYDEHGVIFFRNQRITPPQQVAFTRRFGEIEFNIFGERWSGQPRDRRGVKRHGRGAPDRCPA